MEGRPDIDGIVEAAGNARAALAACDRPALLEAIAAALAAQRDAIIRTCADETALTPEELAPEFERMTGTLRMFAALVREGSWVRAAIDTRSDQSIGTGHDVRRMLIPLDGAVAVFGASNFPLAYGVCGGDTASALAAGCPVVVKEHPAHPRTGRLLAGIATAAMRAAVPGLFEEPEPADRAIGRPGTAVLGYVHDDGKDNSVGTYLAQCRGIAAIGFTGSREGGMALDAVARARTELNLAPVPVFAEMGSTNRVVIHPHALAVRGPAIAAELAASILARHGQQCTRAGLISLPVNHQAGPAFVAELARRLDAAPARRMLSPRVTDLYVQRCRRLLDSSMQTREGVPLLSRATAREDPEVTVNGERRTVPVLLAAMEVSGSLDGIQVLAAEDRGWWLNDEIFGPAAIVLGSDGGDMLYYSDPALVTTIYADPEDIEELTDRDADTNEPNMSFQTQRGLITTGRLTFNSVPTGVRVAPAMVHGGPFPATNRPDTTAVGPLAIERWCRPVCFQNCPQPLLPPELRDDNPRGIRRLVNGEWTAAPICASR